MPVSAVVGAVAVIGAGVSAYQQNEARKETRRANNRAARIEAIKAQRERTQALRQSRMQSASIINQGAGAGLAGSTAVQGSLASLGSQTASNFQFTNSVNTLSAQREAALSRAQNAQNIAGIAGTVSSTAMNFVGG